MIWVVNFITWEQIRKETSKDASMMRMTKSFGNALPISLLILGSKLVGMIENKKFPSVRIDIKRNLWPKKLSRSTVYSMNNFAQHMPTYGRTGAHITVPKTFWVYKTAYHEVWNKFKILQRNNVQYVCHMYVLKYIKCPMPAWKLMEYTEDQ